MKRSGRRLLRCAFGDGFAWILKCVDSQCGPLMTTFISCWNCVWTVGIGYGFLSSRRWPRWNGMWLTRCSWDLENGFEDEKNMIYEFKTSEVHWINKHALDGAQRSARRSVTRQSIYENNKLNNDLWCQGWRGAEPTVTRFAWLETNRWIVLKTLTKRKKIERKKTKLKNSK